MTRKTFVIVGAGLAGATAAKALRDEGFDGRVVVVGAEPDRPYHRPPLSKAFLRGEVGRDAFHVHDAGFYSAQEIELWLESRAVRVDVADRAVEVADGRRLRYDALLLATGSAPRRLRAPGAELDGVVH